MEMVLEKAEVSSVVDQGSESIKNKSENLDQVIREEPKVGRNELIKVTNGQETKEMKYKKAKPLIESGEWRIT